MNITLHAFDLIAGVSGTKSRVFHAKCYFQLSPGGDSQITPPPPQKNTQNTKNIKICIEFTPQICVPPITWSLELTLLHAPGPSLYPMVYSICILWCGSIFGSRGWNQGWMFEPLLLCFAAVLCMYACSHVSKHTFIHEELTILSNLMNKITTQQWNNYWMD